MCWLLVSPQVQFKDWLSTIKPERAQSLETETASLHSLCLPNPKILFHEKLG